MVSLECGQGGVLLEALAEPDSALVSDLVLVETAKRSKVDGSKTLEK